MRDRVRRAADTLRRLPAHGCFPAGHKAQWPDIVRSVNEAYGYSSAYARLPRPSPEAIDDCDTICALVMHLRIPDQRLIWLRAFDVPWKPICAYFGAGRTVLWQQHQAALARLCELELSAEQKIA